MLVADEPVPLVVLAQVLERSAETRSKPNCVTWPRPYVAEGRGFDLREIAGGWAVLHPRGLRAAGRAFRQRRTGGQADPGGARDAKPWWPTASR